MRLKIVSTILLGSLALGGVVQSIAVPAKHAANSQTVQQSVNLNKADVDTLAAVKGIGPKRAAAIVAYRQKNGNFKSIDDLDNVKGFGAKLIAKVKNRLVV